LHYFVLWSPGGYDLYTGDMIIFGSNEATQIAPTPTPLTLSNVVGSYQDGNLASNLDQGGADGFGHIFVADNSGQLFFEDYWTSGSVASPTYVAQPFLIPNLDDLAPLVGAGAPPPTGVPQFPLGIFALLAFMLPVLMGLRAIKGKWK
jgi:hypothetical protein